MKLYVCKGKRQANYLLDKECHLIRIDCDQKSRNYLVFIFEWDDCLDKALDSWKIDGGTYLIS